MEIYNKREAVISLLSYMAAVVAGLITTFIGGKGGVFVANVIALPEVAFTNKFVTMFWLILMGILCTVGIGVYGMFKFYHIGYFYYLKCQEEDNGSEDTDKDTERSS